VIRSECQSALEPSHSSHNLSTHVNEQDPSLRRPGLPDSRSCEAYGSRTIGADAKGQRSSATYCFRARWSQETRGDPEQDAQGWITQTDFWGANNSADWAKTDAPHPILTFSRPDARVLAALLRRLDFRSRVGVTIDIGRQGIAPYPVEQHLKRHMRAEGFQRAPDDLMRS